MAKNPTRKIYIASTFSLTDEVKEVSAILERKGFQVPCKWWVGIDIIPNERNGDYGSFIHTLKRQDQKRFYSHPACKSAYERDAKAVKECDLFLFVADDKPRAYNGANIELGMALAYGKPSYSIGNLDNSALYYPVIKCKNLSEVLENLEHG